MSAARRIVGLGARIAIAAVLLAWIFHAIFLNEGRLIAQANGVDFEKLPRSERWHYAWQHGPPALWQTLSRVEPTALALSVLVMSLTLLIGVLRWRMVLRVHGLDLPLGRALEISFVAHFFNSFLLGSTGGDLMKAYYAARETHHKKTEAVVTVLVDRMIGLWAMLLFAVLMMLPNYQMLFGHSGLRALAGLILGLAGLGTAAVVLAFWGGVSKAWSGAHAWLRRLPKGEWIERSLESARQFGREPLFLPRTLAISMLLNFVCVAQFWVLCGGLNISVSPWLLLTVVPIIICVSALPITPSGLGVRENLFVIMLAHPAVNVSATSALSLSLLAYAGSLFWSLIGGVVYVLFRDKHHLAEIESANNGLPPEPQEPLNSGSPRLPSRQS